MPGTNFMQSKNAEGNQSNYPTYSKVSKKKKKILQAFSLILFSS